MAILRPTVTESDPGRWDPQFQAEEHIKTPTAETQLQELEEINQDMVKLYKDLKAMPKRRKPWNKTKFTFGVGLLAGGVTFLETYPNKTFVSDILLSISNPIIVTYTVLAASLGGLLYKYHTDHSPEKLQENREEQVKTFAKATSTLYNLYAQAYTLSKQTNQLNNLNEEQAARLGTILGGESRPSPKGLSRFLSLLSRNKQDEAKGIFGEALDIDVFLGKFLDQFDRFERSVFLEEVADFLKDKTDQASTSVLVSNRTPRRLITEERKQKLEQENIEKAHIIAKASQLTKEEQSFLLQDTKEKTKPRKIRHAHRHFFSFISRSRRTTQLEERIKKLEQQQEKSTSASEFHVEELLKYDTVNRETLVDLLDRLNGRQMRAGAIAGKLQEILPYPKDQIDVIKTQQRAEITHA